MKNWSGNNRARFHDYASKCIYHITMLKAKEAPAFGRLAGDFRIPVGSPGSSYIAASPTGRAVKQALRLISDLHPALKLFQYALMPYHLHMVIAATDRLDEAIGRKLARFKFKAAELAQTSRIFELGFNDQIIYNSRSLDTIYKYLRENPYRLAVRRAFPQYFSKINSITIGNIQLNAYGNMHLLNNPFKEQVVIHRADSAAVKDANRNKWMHVVANGGVLVSPFISKEEKEIRKKAEEIDGRIILISNEILGERQKPSGNDFARCAGGNLLILIPTNPPISPSLSRADCLAMNKLAGMISQS